MHQSKAPFDEIPTAKPLDHLALCGKDSDLALRLRRETLDYAELNRRTGQLACWLQEQGFVAGDRVATWLPKTETACIMPLAAARAGLVHVPVNPLLKHMQVAHILSDSDAKCLISNTSRLRSLNENDVPDGCTLYDEKMAMEEWKVAERPLEPSNSAPDTLAAILYTSGSTGRPKGVMLSHINLWLGAVSVASYLGLVPMDKTLCVLPLSFDYGQNQLLSTWYAGGCTVPLDYLTARDVIKACAKYEITTLAAVPPLWVQLVEQEWTGEAVRPIKRLTNSGGALTPTLVKQLRAIFCDADIYAMYGLTEAFRSTYLDPALIDDNPNSMGKAIPFAEIIVVNDAGDRAGTDEEGELVHAGPLVAQGYWQDTVRTAERFKAAPHFSKFGGMAVWSGDRVRRDKGGLLYFVGRRDAMIKSSGNRISPAEIETAALDSGLVAETVALGIADERLGHEIVLFVRALAGQNADMEHALKQILKKELPNFMVPHRIMMLESFPKNPNGKLDRTALKKIAKEQAI